MHILTHTNRLLERSVFALSEYTTLKGELRKHESLVKSPAHEILSEDMKGSIRITMDSIADKAKRQLRDVDRAIQQLIPKDAFPFAQPPAPAHNDAAYDQMNKTLTGLRQEAEELYASVGKLQAAASALKFASITPAPAAPAPSTTENAEPGEVVAQPDPRPRKRRRLSVDGDLEEPSTSVPPAAADIDAVKENIVTIEDHITELENELVQYDNKVAMEVESQLDYHFGEMGLGKGAGRATNMQLTEKVEELMDGVAQTDKKATKLAEALSQLDIKGKNKDEALGEELRAKNKQLREQIDEVSCSVWEYPDIPMHRGITLLFQAQKHHDDMANKLEQQSNEIAALKQSVKAFISQAERTDVSPVPMPDPSEIFESIRPHLLRAVQENVQPMLNKTQAEVEKLLREQVNQVDGSVIASLTPTVRSVQIISDWIDNVRSQPSSVISDAGGVRPLSMAPPSRIPQALSSHSPTVA